MDTLDKERAEWEAKHPDQDYDEFINAEIDNAKE